MELLLLTTLSALRVFQSYFTLKNERNEKINELNNIIGSETATAAEINEAIEEKNRINSITECELLLELEIISMGYQDAFVHVTDSGIDVTVISSEHSISKANEIIKKTRHWKSARSHRAFVFIGYSYQYYCFENLKLRLLLTFSY